MSTHFYADDIQLYCYFKDSEDHFLAEFLECISSIKNWLSSNFLRLNSDKTETLIIAPDNKVATIKKSPWIFKIVGHIQYQNPWDKF